MFDPAVYDVLRPDPAGTIQSLGSLGYSPEAAVADLVDNSIAAKATQVDIRCHWAGASASWVSLCDNGTGMTEADLLRGLTVGGRGNEERDHEDLGRFGMGLKTASFSQARQLIVASRVRGGEWSVRTWDVDHVLRVGDWQLLHGCPEDAREVLSERMTTVKNSGTVILWRRLTRLVADGAQPGDEWAMRDFYAHVNRIDTHLGMVFARYLSGRRRLRILLDQHDVLPWDPFMSGHKFVEPLASEMPLPGITVQGFVLPHRSRLTPDEYLAAGGPAGWLEQQGFYVYRRDRLIVAGDWLKLGDFRKDERHTLARISVDLPREHDLRWSLDVKKSTAMPPPELVGHLRRVAKATRDRAGAVANHRGRVVRDGQTSSPDFTWRVLRQFGRTKLVINREQALIKDLTDRAPHVRAEVSNLLKMIESTLPLGLIRSTTDVGEFANTSDIEGDVPDDVLEMARRMLTVLLGRGVQASEALARVSRMPPFSDYPQVADVLSGRPSESLEEDV